MSLFGSLERSTSNPVLSTIATRPLLDFLYPASLKASKSITTRHRAFYRVSHSSSRDTPRADSKAMDNVFIQALVHASSCWEHRTSAHFRNQKSHYSTLKHRYRRGSTSSREYIRNFRTNTTAQSAQAATVEFTKEELNGLVDIYGTRASYYRAKERPNSSQDFEIPVVGDDEIKAVRENPAVPLTPLRSRADMNAIVQIEKLLEDENSSHEEVYDLYQSLPFPRVSCLPGRTIGDLLNHFAVVEKKDEATMLRYLSILDDMKAAHKPLTITEWSSAIAFAGKWARKVTNAEVQSAMYIFREMEGKAGVKGNFYTFNILYDIATKAGKFALADAFVREMERRDIPPSRHFKTSRIYYYGCRKDGDGVRAAYRDLVDSGHVVDTVVLNCVIAALIRAGEPVSAEHVFLKMKHLDEEKTNPNRSVKTWRQRRKSGVLMSVAHFKRHDNPKQLERLHETSSVAPDMTTYRLLVGYHARKSGNIDRVTELLNEITDRELPLDGAIFSYLFRGFNVFGGVPYSAWTRARLEKTWTAFKDAIEHGNKSVEIQQGTAALALKAFGRCDGPQRALEVWEEIKDRWKPTEEEARAVMNRVRDSIPRESEVFKY